ncbi:unnamed protein product, partial [Ectocarpus sp. 8 AP-2014]
LRRGIARNLRVRRRRELGRAFRRSSSGLSSLRRARCRRRGAGSGGHDRRFFGLVGGLPGEQPQARVPPLDGVLQKGRRDLPPGRRLQERPQEGHGLAHQGALQLRERPRAPVFLSPRRAR